MSHGHSIDRTARPARAGALAHVAGALLERYYGTPALKPQLDPTSELVQTILSQNTSDINSAAPSRGCARRYPSWDEVLDADVE
jgi:endonuclease III